MKIIIISSFILANLCAKAQVTQPTNAITSGSFIGTSNTEPVIFKRNGIFSGSITNGVTSFGLNSCQSSHLNSTAFGENALKNNAYPAGGNTAVGYSSLFSNTNGGGNVAIGENTLFGNIHGDSNIAIGSSALFSNIGGERPPVGLRENDGDFNIGIGTSSLYYNTMGQGNVALGSSTLRNTRGSLNVGLGHAALNLINGDFNIGIGYASGNYMTSGNYNTLIGNRVGASNGPATGLNSGSHNIFIGNGSGEGITSGSGNTIIGVNGGLPSTLNSTALLGYNSVGGNGIVGLTMSNYNAGFGSKFRLAPGTIPQNTLEISQGNIGKSGLRFTNLTNTTPPIPNPSLLTNKGVLSVDLNGDVILVTDQSGGITSNCAVTNFIPRTANATGNLSCSQVYDSNVNGVGGVGINTITPGNRLEIKHGKPDNSGLRFTNLTSLSPVKDENIGTVLSVNSTGDVVLVKDLIGSTLKNNCKTTNFITKTGAGGNLTCSSIYDDGAGHVGFGFGATPSTVVNVSINGSSATFGGSYNVSDIKFKKNIKTIENSLDKIMLLEGKTYNWKKEEYKNINFTDELQYGLIAQEVQKVLPSLVLKTDNGELAMNYIGLIPVLIEGMKAQQSQIVALNNQIADLVSKGILDENKITDGKTYFSSNYPNPFETSTKIDYFIDKTIKEAQIMVYDMNGSTISKYDLKERGTTSSLVINKENMKSGIYFYTLITDGAVIGTKKMIVK